MSHFNSDGDAHMVDVSTKSATDRIAIARSFVTMSESAASAIRDAKVRKGDVLSIARLAGIMGVKQTPNLIPLCHTLLIDQASVDFAWDDDRLRITATVRTNGRTGVEMEAMTAVSVAALTVYDMIKSVDRWVSIGPTELLEKSGGKSGRVVRDD